MYDLSPSPGRPGTTTSSPLASYLVDEDLSKECKSDFPCMVVLPVLMPTHFELPESIPLPSRGSAACLRGEGCRPCGFMQSPKGCKWLEACDMCHIPSHKTLRNRNRRRRRSQEEITEYQTKMHSTSPEAAEAESSEVCITRMMVPPSDRAIVTPPRFVNFQ